MGNEIPVALIRSVGIEATGVGIGIVFIEDEAGTGGFTA
jgi:hypothetical protein